MLLFIQVNGEFPFHKAGNFDGAQKKTQILAQGFWPSTFRLNPTTLGKPIGPVTRENSWEACLGPPVEQRVRGEKELFVLQSVFFSSFKNKKFFFYDETKRVI